VKELLEYIDALHASMPQPPSPDENVEELRTEMPPALKLVAEGLGRIAEIVRSMKDFAHADQKEMCKVDLNRAIASTLVIARSEYKPVAEVETDFGSIPLVLCHAGQINQVVLNIVVNAAHAIADKVQRTGAVGKISVSTGSRPARRHCHQATPATAFPKRSAHAFSTRSSPPRKWGEALARVFRSRTNVIVKGHGGELDFTTEPGKGTTFFVRLPLTDS
jgi:signal transduction histidine kinase